MAAIVEDKIVPVEPECEDPRELVDLMQYDDYFDIMLIGKTGLGKTTTADKLLVANPTGRKYQDENRHKKESEDAMRCFKNTLKANGVSHIEDLSMWLISNELGDLDTMEQRLKNLIFCRLMRHPHEEIHRLREDSEVTKFCELLSNDTSKIRVLDVPGFFSAELGIGSRDILERAEATAVSNLQIMRRILQIKAAYHFKFNRIVYFLPEHGVLRRSSQVLQMEIQTMEAYFGRSIFECMVVVATHDRSAYDSFPKDAKLFSLKDLEKTRFHFQQAMRSVFGDSLDVPKPPIEFLSYRNNCEDTLSIIKNTHVFREGVKLSFNSSTCARCNIRLKVVKANIYSVADKEKRRKKTDIVMCLHPGSLIEIPYSDTSCHPMIVPKYSVLQRIAGGIAHLVLPKKYVRADWPTFRNFDEVCIACRLSPGTTGCRRVKIMYRKRCHLCRKCNKCQLCSDECKESKEWKDCSKCKVCRLCRTCPECKDGILVNHTDKVEEKYKIKRQNSDD